LDLHHHNRKTEEKTKKFSSQQKFSPTTLHKELGKKSFLKKGRSGGKRKIPKR